MTNTANKATATVHLIDAATKPAGKRAAPKKVNPKTPKPRTTKPETPAPTNGGASDKVREALTIADKAMATASDAQDTFKRTLDALSSVGVTVASLTGKSGATLEGAHFAPAKDSIAKRVFTAKQYAVYINSEVAKKIDGKDTPRGAMHKKVNTRLSNLRTALERNAAKVSKGAAPAKATPQDAWKKKVLDQAAKFKALAFEQKTPAAQESKAAWGDAKTLHALTIKYMDEVMEILPKK